MRKILAALPAALIVVVVGCASFGDAETPAQKSYRAAAILAYVQIPAVNYASLPSRDPAVLQRVQQAELAAYESVQAARAVIEQGGDVTSAALTASSSVASVTLQVLGQAAVPRNEVDIVRKGIVSAQVAAQSPGQMRLFRKQFVNAKLEAFVASKTDPTEADWAEIMEVVEGNHALIQDSAS